MKLLQLHPVSTIFVAISVVAKPVNPEDHHVRLLRGKEDDLDAPFIGDPLSGANEVTRQLSHLPCRRLHLEIRVIIMYWRLKHVP